MSFVSLLTKVECAKIIEKTRNFTNFEINRYEIVPCENVIGFLGEYFHLILNIHDCDSNSTAVQNCFIKSIPKSEKERKFIEDCGILKKEVKLYTSLLSVLQKYTKTKFLPKCYYSRENVLVLEEVVELGYSHFDSLELTALHLESILKSLAALHASSMAFEVKNDINIGECYNDIVFEITVSKDIDYFRTGLEAIKSVIANHPKYKSEVDRIDAILASSVNSVYDMVNPSTKYKNVLCHRDPWGRNIFFDATNPSTPAILVDFQTCRYCPPAIDFLFSMYMNTRRTQRDSIFEDYVEFYHKSLSMELQTMHLDVNDYLTFQDFQNSCQDFKLFGVLYKCIAETVVSLPDGYLTNLRHTSPDEYFHFANVDRTNVILEFVRTDEKFRKLIYESVDELMEIMLVAK